ncbi:hypothetical protein NUH88_12920 [Nisaea acidiphila]|uniref:Sulfotransferase family protein n=1 Tax=Nisaea acidiphila TaxID=1862145 RepID=A0A9J7APN7_9PROT|nr:hypothetical protein [Nisaea acidiphila]UUX48316.1 hypothetical protein NUH88_12920 [Nisaea acidiphila]
MIVSVHIPKTAGTSLREALEENFGERLLLDYGDRPLAQGAAAEEQRARSAEEARTRSADILRDYDAIHGHFLAAKYDVLGPAARFATFFRDPATRVLSHFGQWQRLPHAPNPIAARIGSGELDVFGFAALPEIRDLYRTFTSDFDLDRFTFIGITEEYDRSIELFNAIFGTGIATRESNIGPEQSNGAETDADVLKRLRELQPVDAKLYDLALKRFDRLCEQFL